MKKRSTKKNVEAHAAMDNFLADFPKGSYKEFTDEYPKVKISDAVFYAVRRKKSRKRPYARSVKAPVKSLSRVSSKIVNVMYSRSTSELAKMPADDVLRDVFNAVNKATHLGFDVVTIISMEGKEKVEVRRLTK